jgi:hypothetical protein
MRRVSIPLALLILLQAATSASAWGPLGHRLTARLAERHLNPKAKAAIAALLEPGESIATASLWADDHRRDVKGSGPWHYVDVPLDQDRYDDKFSGPEPEKGFIVPKIREFRAILKDPSRPVEVRRLALRFLLHLIEDLHMPLHVGDNHDRGGNDTQVQFFDQGSNMHRVWDSNILEHAGRDEDKWLADLIAMDTEEARTKVMGGTVEDWATESLLLARAAYKDPATGQKIKSGQKLGEAYQVANLPIARQRLYRAGIRLAIVLNEEFPER